MAFVQWSDTLSTGVTEIDDQHKSLVEMLNSLHDAADEGETATVVDIVSKMKQYAIMHFSTEERYMKRMKYPDMLEHMSEHAFFVSRVKDFTAANSEEVNMLPAVMDFLKKWLVEHISNADVKMGRFLQQHA